MGGPWRSLGGPLEKLRWPLGVIRVLVKGKEVKPDPPFYARGGYPLAKRVPDVENPGHSYGQSPKVTKQLGVGKPVESNRWGGWSRIPGGAPLKDDGKEVKFMRGKTEVNTTKVGLTREQIGQAELDNAIAVEVLAGRVAQDWRLGAVRSDKGKDFAYTLKNGRRIVASIPKSWDLNDFGKTAFRVGDTGAYVHTTPLGEAQFKRGEEETLDFSHGCIHIKPSDRKVMEKLGYLRKGVKITIKAFKTRTIKKYAAQVKKELQL